MNNIRDLEVELCNVFDDLKKDPRRCAQAKELANVAGKIINTQKINAINAKINISPIPLNSFLFRHIIAN